MKKKPQLDDADVVFDPTPLTKKEERQLSEFIRQLKVKRKRKQYGQRAGKIAADLFDAFIAESRKDEKSVSWTAVKKGLKRKSKL